MRCAIKTCKPNIIGTAFPSIRLSRLSQHMLMSHGLIEFGKVKDRTANLCHINCV